MAGTPKDHYVPQFYLDAFAIEGPGMDKPHIYQYMPEETVSPRISDVASEKHFYTVEEKDTGKPLRDLDDILSMSEGPASVPLKRIITEGKIDLSDEERADLAIFFSLLAVRTPGFMNTQKSMVGEVMKEIMTLKAEHKEHFKRSHEHAGLNLNEAELEDQRRFVLEKRYDIQFNNNGYFLAQGLGVSQEVAEWYYEHKFWHLLISDSDKVFITSDNPVSIYRPNFGNTLMNGGYKHGTLVVSISPRHALLLRDLPHGSPVLEVSSSRVEKMNENTMRFSNDYVFSNLNSRKIAEMYRQIGNKGFQQIEAKRHNFAPYVFFMPPPIPAEPLF